MRTTCTATNIALMVGAGDAGTTTCGYRDSGSPLVVVLDRKGGPVHVGGNSMVTPACYAAAGFAVLNWSRLASIATQLPAVADRWDERQA